jgi:predicted transposase/invertase (TIGR01784 family)
MEHNLIEARKEGVAEGLSRGLSRGLSQGLSQGRSERSAAIARNALALGLPIDQIEKLTDLSRAEIENILPESSRL